MKKPLLFYSIVLVLLLGDISCSKRFIISCADVQVKNQEHDFTLGLNPIHVIISKTYYYPKTHEFEIVGIVDDVNHNGNNNIRYSIKKIRNSDTTYYGKTGKYGVFRLRGVPYNDIFKIEGEQDKYVWVDDVRAKEVK